MSLWTSIVGRLLPLVPALIVAAVVIAALLAARRLLTRRFETQSGRKLGAQVIMLVLSFAGFLAIVLALPLSDSSRGQLLSLLGVVLSAAIALSSTTLLGNAMAGLMLRATSSFRMGDYLAVGEQFGRVSERGLFHVEIQTEDSDLTTLPNLYLVTQPVKVVRSSGTIVSATVSLGYDVPRSKIEQALLAAAAQSELQEPFVQILELGDFSVVYRIAGLLAEVKTLISTKSRLRRATLDALHDAGIEIVSPSFMNTRSFPQETTFIPATERVAPAAASADREQPSLTVEELVFDKAEEAEKSDLEAAIEQLGAELEAAQEKLAASRDDGERADLTDKITKLAAERARLAEALEDRRPSSDES